MNDGAKSRSDAVRSDKGRKARATTSTAEAGEPAPLPGTVVPFRAVEAGFRRGLGVDEPRGQILLFTGVRYERREPPATRPRPRRRTADGLRQPQS